MEILFLILIFAGIFAIHDGIRKVNNNTLHQTEELKKIHEQLKENSHK